MRQRKVKNEEEKIAQFDRFIIKEPKAWKGKWVQAFPPQEKGENQGDELYMEIGCGKGQFITTMARRYPQRRFIAVEGAGTVVLRALEKAAGEKALSGADGGQELSNIRFITDYVQTLNDLFEPGEVKGIYLNFSDPWPKDRHAKRRLTHRKYLSEYKKILAPGSILEFKTDNDELFAFSVREFQEFGLELLELTDDLHGVLSNDSPDAGEGESISALTTTEYEDRFTAVGKNIHYCRVRF